MKKNLGSRECFVKTVGGKTEYFVQVEGQSVQVSEEVYRFLESSNNKEMYQRRVERKLCPISYDQLVDDIEQMDHHGSMPLCLKNCSAEEVFFQEIEKKDKHSVAKALSEEIERLSETDHMIINTFLQGRSGVLFAAKQLGISERTIYYHRKRLASQLAKKVQERRK